eukprot:363866-Chlamydomonas_euryale.AAC.7
MNISQARATCSAVPPAPCGAGIAAGTSAMSTSAAAMSLAVTSWRLALPGVAAPAVLVLCSRGGCVPACGGCLPWCDSNSNGCCVDGDVVPKRGAWAAANGRRAGGCTVAGRERVASASEQGLNLVPPHTPAFAKLGSHFDRRRGALSAPLHAAARSLPTSIAVQGPMPMPMPIPMPHGSLPSKNMWACKAGGAEGLAIFSIWHICTSKVAKHGWALASFNNLEDAPTSIPHQTRENRHANAPCKPSIQKYVG